MKEIFSKYGKLKGVFIAGKRNKLGKRFGFACFTEVSNPAALEGLLNTICIGTQKIHCNIARFQRRTNQSHEAHTHHKSVVRKPQPPTASDVKYSCNSYVNILKGNNSYPPIPKQTTLNIQLNFSTALDHDSFTSVVAELKSISGATNTHNLILDEGFGDSPSNTLVAFTSCYNYPTMNLPPKFIWLSETFSSIAKHWGQVIIPEDCNARQFNRTLGKVFILTKHHDFIKEAVSIPLKKELLLVRVYETEGEIESIFNGYLYDSSSDKDDDSSDDDTGVDSNEYADDVDDVNDKHDSVNEESGENVHHGDACVNAMAAEANSGENSVNGTNSNHNTKKNPNREKTKVYQGSAFNADNLIKEGSTSFIGHGVCEVPMNRSFYLVKA
ncbi:cytochrome P450 [Tanacetum coccineum]